VHTATISVAVMNAQGKLLMECILETKAATILEFIQGLRGTLAVTFEEGTMAAWLHDLLKPHVDRLVVCDPRKNALMRDGNQNDRVDARNLAELLRTNQVHADLTTTSLNKELVGPASIPLYSCLIWISTSSSAQYAPRRAVKRGEALTAPDGSRQMFASERFRRGVGNAARGCSVRSSAGANWWRRSAVLAAWPAGRWRAPCGQRAAGARTAPPSAPGGQRADLVQFGYRERAVQLLLARRCLLY